MVWGPALKKLIEDKPLSELKQSLTKRLCAWWEGSELPRSAEGIPEWSPVGQELVTLIWGEGFVLPVTPESIVDLAQPLGPP